MFIRPLSNALQEKAERELNEVPDRIEEDLEHIRGWLNKQPHLKARTDDQWLLSFLRGCKFSLQKTKKKLDLFYTMRSLVPEFFGNRDPFQPEIQEFLKRGLCLVLPKPTEPAGPKVVIYRVGPSDPEKVSFLTGMKVSLMILDILMMENDNFMIGGQHFIYDLQDLSYKYMAELTPSIIKKVIMCLQYAHPTRPKGFHFINVPHIFECVLNLLAKFAIPVLKERAKLYTRDNFDTIYETIPASILPKEYGGEGDSVDKLTAELKKKVESYREWFLEDTNYGTDETKRPGIAKTSADLFGEDGSFRKLTID